jgi:NitT/TauT family transport system substrate-binding protein
MEKVLGVDVNKVKVGDSFTNTYAQKANQLEGFTTTTTPEGAVG